MFFSKKYKNYLQVIFLTWCVFSTNASAESIKISTIGIAPWAYIDEFTGKPIGDFVAIIEEIKKRTNLNIQITLSPFSFDRIMRELEFGRQDCVMLIDLGSDDLVLGESVVDMLMGVVPHKDVRLDHYLDLEGKLISVYYALAKSAGLDNPLINKELDKNYEMGLQKLKHKRVHGVAGSIVKLRYLAEKQGISEHLGTPLVLESEPIKLQCAQNSTSLQYMEVLNKAIRDIKADGALQKILHHYH